MTVMRTSYNIHRLKLLFWRAREIGQVHDLWELKWEIKLYFTVNLHMFWWCIGQFLTSLDIGYLNDALMSLLP